MAFLRVADVRRCVGMTTDSSIDRHETLITALDAEMGAIAANDGRTPTQRRRACAASDPRSIAARSAVRATSSRTSRWSATSRRSPARRPARTDVRRGSTRRSVVQATLERIAATAPSAADHGGPVRGARRRPRDENRLGCAVEGARGARRSLPGGGLRPATGWCEAHHIKHWAHGGETRLENLELLCWEHHRQRHNDAWRRRPDRQ